jgi:hypothetical protein
MGQIVTCSTKKVINTQAEQFIPLVGAYTCYVNGFQVNASGSIPQVYTLQYNGAMLPIEVGDWVAKDDYGSPMLIPSALFNTFFTTQLQYIVSPPTPIMGPPGPPGPPGKDAVWPEPALRVMLETEQLERDHYRMEFLDSNQDEYIILLEQSRQRNETDGKQRWVAGIELLQPTVTGRKVISYSAASWREAVDWVEKWIRGQVKE